MFSFGKSIACPRSNSNPIANSFYASNRPQAPVAYAQEAINSIATGRVLLAGASAEGSRTTTTLNQLADLTVSSASGNLSASAGCDVNLIGATLSSQGSAQVQAARNLSLGGRTVTAVAGNNLKEAAVQISRYKSFK